MVQGSWVGHPLSVFFLLFSVLFFIPCERIICPGGGWGFHPLCHDPFPFLRSSHSYFLLLSFLGVDARRPRGGGI